MESKYYAKMLSAIINAQQLKPVTDHMARRMKQAEACAEVMDKEMQKTPFLSIDKDVILIGNMILEVDEKNNPKPMKPMKVCFGQYEAKREDDWGVKSICHGYHIEFHDGGVYSLTQDGGGYSIAAKNCKIVKKRANGL
jgi:hypothetical protein